MGPAPKFSYAPVSSLGIVPPKSRLTNGGLFTPAQWLKERRDTDGAEGYWRIHDGLYDFTNFVKDHPGGEDWLLLTKGTDISEAFETHHISQLPEQLIKKYLVKTTQTRRNTPFVFEETGFYKTLKKEVREALKTIPKSSYTTSDFYSDILCVGLFISSILAVNMWSYILAIIAGIHLGLLTTAAHNYIHQKDSFRLLYFQFSLFKVRDWRISHVLSHHLFTNTVIDLEMSMPEPFLQYHPIKKFLGGYYSWIMSPVVWLFNFHMQFFKRLTSYETMQFSDLNGFILLFFMYTFGGKPILDTFFMWNIIILAGSLEFTLVGLHAAHHHPDVFHDGDCPRSLESYDWGLSQLDAVMDRSDITGSDFLVLTSFGDHCLHHLFPTLDHSILKHLYSTLQKVMRQFDVNLRITTQWGALLGGLQQLVKVKPNPLPPDLKNKKYILW